jgi:hypothetical protein
MSGWWVFIIAVVMWSGVTAIAVVDFGGLDAPSPNKNKQAVGCGFGLASAGGFAAMMGYPLTGSIFGGAGLVLIALAWIRLELWYRRHPHYRWHS